jgi:hypothetical protein
MSRRRGKKRLPKIISALDPISMAALLLQAIKQRASVALGWCEAPTSASRSASAKRQSNGSSELDKLQPRSIERLLETLQAQNLSRTMDSIPAFS